MSALSIEQAMQIAIGHHQAGRLGEAEALYRRVLATQPDHANAMHLLGVVAHQRNDNAAALDLLGRAIALNPFVPEFHSNQGTVLLALGRLQEATAAFRHAVLIKPDYPEAHTNLGAALRSAGRLDEALEACQTAVALRGDFADAHRTLSAVLRDLGRFEEAFAAGQRAVELRPDLPDAWGDLGDLLMATQQAQQAVEAYRRALALRPDWSVVHNNLGAALRRLGRLDEALAGFQRAVELHPDLLPAQANLANALRAKGDLGRCLDVCRRVLAIQPDHPEVLIDQAAALRRLERLDESLAAYQRALAVQPENPELHGDLCELHYHAGRLEDALAAGRRAIELKPDLAEAHWNYGLALLLGGDFARGWEEYDWRRRMNFPALLLNFDKPHWDGSTDPIGKTILVTAEQGLGDLIQFCRYVPLLAERGAKVILGCQPEFVRLMRTLPGVAQIITRGDPLPSFDMHTPVMSLPRAFGTTVETIPANVPYLQADPALAAAWRARLSTVRGLKVGLAWAGSPTHTNDRNRSLPPAALSPLAEVKGVQWVSLQKGPTAGAQSPPPGMHVRDDTAGLRDFADTAALIDCLDLVITVDTAVAHLAGAMGKRVWVILPKVPDWRWLRDREDSPWYPTMRLFRQPSAGDWPRVIERIASELTVMTTGWS